MKILFASAEVHPFSKVGGLGDVLGGLPKELAKNDIDIRVITPLYGSVDRFKYNIEDTGITFPVNMGVRQYTCHIFQSNEYKLHPDYPVFFIYIEEFFEARGVYTDARGNPYEDNPVRFAIFQKAVLVWLTANGWLPDIVHCHDNHTALIPVYMKHSFYKYSKLANVKTILTLHNIAYQGTSGMDLQALLDLPEELFDPMYDLEWYEQLNPLKGGILSADEVTTVSPTHAVEITTDPVLGAGMNEILKLRAKPVVGILNGVDYSEWHPATDEFLGTNYDIRSLELKHKNKVELLKTIGFDAKFESKPVIGLVSRLVEQKGIDLLVDGLDRILSMDTAVILLGSGEPKYHNAIQEIADKHPQNFYTDFNYNNPLSHKIVAGSDLFLMPSRYEPCGITQMFCLKYGTLPLVRKTGGLADTVIDNETGFVFEDYTADAMLAAIRKALRVFQNKDEWQKIMKNGMQKNYSWHESAIHYIELYKQLIAEN